MAYFGLDLLEQGLCPTMKQNFANQLGPDLGGIYIYIYIYTGIFFVIHVGYLYNMEIFIMAM